MDLLPIDGDDQYSTRFHGFEAFQQVPCHIHISSDCMYLEDPLNTFIITWNLLWTRILTTHEVFLSSGNFDTTGYFIFHF